MGYRKMNTSSFPSTQLAQTVELTDEDRLTIAENERIIAKREEFLLGKEIEGTLIVTIRKSGKKTFWIRFNKRKNDQILVKSSLVVKAFGNDCPPEGSQVKCTISALGPNFPKTEVGSARSMHPQTKAIEVVCRGFPNQGENTKPIDTLAGVRSRVMGARLCRGKAPAKSLQSKCTGRRPRFFNSRVKKATGNCTFNLKISKPQGEQKAPLNLSLMSKMMSVPKVVECSRFFR